MAKNQIQTLNARFHALLGEYAKLVNQTAQTVKTTVKKLFNIESITQVTTEGLIKLCEFITRELNLKKCQVELIYIAC